MTTAQGGPSGRRCAPRAPQNAIDARSEKRNAGQGRPGAARGASWQVRFHLAARTRAARSRRAGAGCRPIADIPAHPLHCRLSSPSRRSGRRARTCVRPPASEGASAPSRRAAGTPRSAATAAPRSLSLRWRWKAAKRACRARRAKVKPPPRTPRHYEVPERRAHADPPEWRSPAVLAPVCKRVCVLRSCIV